MLRDALTRWVSEHHHEVASLDGTDVTYVERAMLETLDGLIADCLSAKAVTPIPVGEWEDLLAHSGLSEASIDALREQTPQERAGDGRRNHAQSVAHETAAEQSVAELMRKHPEVADAFDEAHQRGLSWASLHGLLVTPQDLTHWSWPLAWIESNQDPEPIRILLGRQLRHP